MRIYIALRGKRLAFSLISIDLNTLLKIQVGSSNVFLALFWSPKLRNEKGMSLSSSFHDIPAESECLSCHCFLIRVNISSAWPSHKLPSSMYLSDLIKVSNERVHVLFSLSGP
jgi:hypothetical protein